MKDKSGITTSITETFSVKNAGILFLLVSSFFFIYQYHHLFAFTPQALGKYFTVRWLLFGHVIPGATALLIGPVQFIKSLRNKNLALHRWLGKIYMICILVSASTALTLTFITTDIVGKMYTVSLWFLILIWTSSTAMAYWTIRRRNIKEHEEWTVRSYIATFAFIVQNYVLKIPALLTLGSFSGSVAKHILVFMGCPALWVSGIPDGGEAAEGLIGSIAEWDT